MRGLGNESYDNPSFGMGWWVQRALDPAHDRAYKRIARMGQKHKPEPKLIIDYACGAALLIRKLIKTFSSAQIVGLDESVLGLDGGRQLLREMHLKQSDADRISLHRAVLPKDNPQLPKADLLFFSFPDFRGGSSRNMVSSLRKTYPEDWAATQTLHKALKKAGLSPAAAAEIFYKRMATRHYASLVKRGGNVVRVEYAQCSRNNCEDATLAEMDWIDGISRPPKESDIKQRRLFNILESRFYKDAAVMADVFQQTNNEADREGGYLITAFKKL